MTLFEKLSTININNKHLSIKLYDKNDFVALDDCFDKSLFKWFIRHYNDFDDFISEKKTEFQNKKLVPLTIFDNDGKPFGITCLYSLDNKNNSLEVGSTWIAKKYQGTGYNLIFKYYLFKSLVEDFKLNRVQLKADADNLKSIGSMQSVGLNYEGKLLSHMVVQGGRVRDTEMFSITQNTWENIKKFMQSKLNKKYSDRRW